MKKILVILGPTATGKTELALSLAKKFNGEIVSCDSRQVYTGLDIGTGKYPSAKFKVKSEKFEINKGFWKVNGVKIWMYDVISPKIQYSVADYVRDADRVIKAIKGRGKLPIVVGGTGLYLKASLKGIPNLSIPVDQNLRKKLQKLSKQDLREKLKKISINKWNRLNESDRENPRRLIRAIELSLAKFKVTSNKIQVASNDVLKIGLNASREILYKKVDKRVLTRVNQGMIEEAKRLNKGGLTLKRMRQLGLEYGVLAAYLDGKIRDKGELIKILQGKIHGYVRRQLTWFKREKNVNWFDITQKNFLSKVEKLMEGWYYQANEAKS